MIDNDDEYGTIVFYCDGCPMYLDTEETEFGLANEVRKAMGWLSFKDKDDDWNHYCPECQKK